MRSLHLAALIAALAFAGGCERAAGGADEAHPEARALPPYEGEGPIRITCTTGMLADLAAQIGGERVTVEALMGPGTDPHLYRATAHDRRQLTRSDLVLYHGHHLEGKMGEVLDNFARKVPTVAVNERLPRELLLADPEAEDSVDPHVWFDLSLWSRCAGIVADVLCELDPEQKAAYTERARNYRQVLDETDAYIRSRIAEIPEKRRILVTAHDAFQYFGHAYGMEVLGIQGISTDSEPAVRKISELVELMTGRGVPAVFVESTISEKNIRSLVEGCRARGHELRIGGSLYSDAMGGEGSGASSYLGMVRHNIDTIVEALD